MIKNIVFDIGNVLVNFGWADFIKKFGYSEEINERIAKATVKDDDWNEYDRGVLSDEEILQLFIDNDPGIETELRTFEVDFGNLLKQFDYAKGWIKSLQNNGYKVYCLSNMSHKAVRECAEALNFLPMLDGYILSCDVELIKPDSAIYNALFDKYGLVPEESIFIDDLKRNVEAAEKEGMKGIVFTDIKSAAEKIDELSASCNTEPTFKSAYSKAQRAGAVFTLSVMGVLIIATIVFMIIGTEWANRMLKISLGLMIVLPCLAWAYIWMFGKMSHKKTIADFNFFEKDNK